MKTILEFASFGALSLVLTLVFTPIFKMIAVKVGLVDKPNYRKVHVNSVPLVGGISVVFSALFVILIANGRFTFLNEYLPILATAFILFVVGVIDDKKDVKAKYKLTLQLLLAFIVASYDIRITTLYGVFGVYEMTVWVQYLVTILIITGVVNAFNLMDGVDGLAGGLSLLGFTMFLFASICYGDYSLGLLSIIFIGATIGFLKFNLSSKKIFMGDSGSLFLGFLLVTLGIQFLDKQITNTDNNYIYGFLLLVAFFSIPVLDSVRVYMGRIKRGNSPFKADRSHLHHLLLKVGLSHKRVAFTVILFCMMLFVVGFGLVSFLSITLIILSIVLAFWSIIRILLMMSSLQEWKITLKELENR
jgi:UDP-GlcNAc:undecaprenyl-phosphate GlcNAc-1-phosphate transferase